MLGNPDFRSLLPHCDWMDLYSAMWTANGWSGGLYRLWIRRQISGVSSNAAGQLFWRLCALYLLWTLRRIPTSSRDNNDTYYNIVNNNNYYYDDDDYDTETHITR